MKTRNCFTFGALAAIASLASLPTAFAESGKLGKMGPDQFKKTNADASAMVKALSPAGGKFSESDADLLKEIAMGGMMQLELSKVAHTMGSSQDVKMIAEAEVAEQTALGDKVKELAASGGVSLPTQLEKRKMDDVGNLKKKPGLELDKEYLKISGIDGHEALEDAMEKVQSTAENASLKKLAEITLPLIKAHLQIAKDEASDMNDASGGDVSRPDNTKQNTKDMKGEKLTPEDQGGTDSDIMTTKDIRMAVVKSQLSFNAKNIKIITRNGVTTLRGVVESKEEHAAILKIVKDTASSVKVTDELQVK